jgi:hypothetical protein
MTHRLRTHHATNYAEEPVALSFFLLGCILAV